MAHTPNTPVERALAVALALNAAYLVVEAVGGWLSGSLALLSDAAHMLGDVGALALAWGAARIAREAARPEHTFGLRRAETVGAFVNGLLLLAAVAWIIWEAVGRLIGGAPAVAGTTVLVVAAIGLGVNLGSAWYLARADSGNLNVRGALLHMLADALGSVGAIVAALFVLAGYPAADAIVSIAIALLVLFGSWGLLRDATRVLLQLPPPELRVGRVREVLADVPGLSSVHDLHVWTLDGQSGILSAHLVIEDESRWQEVMAEARRRLVDDVGIPHVTLQPECSGHCGDHHCPALVAQAHGHHHGHAH